MVSYVNLGMVKWHRNFEFSDDYIERRKTASFIRNARVCLPLNNTKQLQAQVLG